MAKPILDLATITELPQIAIDGQLYDLNTVQSLPFSTVQTLARMGNRLDALMDIPDRSADQNKELDESLRAIVAVLVKAPKEVLDRLSDQGRVAICVAFQLLPSTRRVLLTTSSQAKEPKARSTGGNSSRGFRPPTRAQSRRRSRG